MEMLWSKTGSRFRGRRSCMSEARLRSHCKGRRSGSRERWARNTVARIWREKTWKLTTDHSLSYLAPRLYMYVRSSEYSSIRALYKREYRNEDSLQSLTCTS